MNTNICAAVPISISDQVIEKWLSTAPSTLLVSAPMSDNIHAPPPLPQSRHWWIIWIASVVGAPAIAIVLALWADSNKFASDMAGVGFALFMLLGFVMHIIGSINLAKIIGRKQTLAGRTPNTAGIIIGLLFGGWAVIAAVFFVGCIGVLVYASSHGGFH